MNFSQPSSIVKFILASIRIGHFIIADKGRKQVRSYDRNRQTVGIHSTIGSSDDKIV